MNLHDIPAFAALAPREQRMVYNASVNSAIEGYTPCVESVTLLCQFVAGEISSDEHLRRLLARVQLDRVVDGV